ncbi:MAG: response regulator transcription factor [Treponema sp.]|nr:response regulator transcription factor [Treponema sp.]
MQNILLVEDNEDIQLVNKRMLDRLYIYKIHLAMNLAEARKMLSESTPDLIVLDIMLPDGNGLDFLKELRRQHKNLPVLLLTALGTPEDEVKGLKSGGDDYLTKPYDYSVLLARIKALLNRAERVPETITKGTMIIKIPSNEVFINDENIRLSQNEFGLLLQFAQNEDCVIGAAYLYEQVWGLKMLEDTSALRNTVYKLRKKLANSGFTIVAERGDGYIFEKE